FIFWDRMFSDSVCHDRLRSLQELNNKTESASKPEAQAKDNLRLRFRLQYSFRFVQVIHLSVTATTTYLAEAARVAPAGKPAMLAAPGALAESISFERNPRPRARTAGRAPMHRSHRGGRPGDSAPVAGLRATA